MILHAAPQCLEQVINQRLTHWGRVTHICVSDLITIGSDNGLSPSRRQAIIWTNARILFIGPLGINFSEILIEIHTFSLKKMHLKMSSAKGRLFRLGLDVINSQETSHTSPSWASYGVSTVKIFEKIDGVKTASQCNEHTQQYEFSTHTVKISAKCISYSDHSGRCMVESINRLNRYHFHSISPKSSATECQIILHQ